MTDPLAYQLSVLPSGVRVVTEPVPGVRSVTLGLWVGVGSRDETGEQAGCSHFLEHLLFKGTDRRSAQDIAEAVDAVGGEMNAFTSKEVTCFYARVLDDDVSLAADVLGDMLTSATNSEQDVDAERQVVLEEINIHHDSPDDLANSDLCEAVFGRHPLGLETLGSFESITGMSHEVVDDYYRSHYRPGNLTVAAAGNVDHDTVLRLVDEHVGDLGRPGNLDPIRTPPTVDAGRVRVRHRPTEQAHVAIGGSALSHIDERRWALRVLDSLLGGSMSSRLFQEVRERRGLAYSTYSYVSSHVDSGWYGVYAGTTPGRVDEAVKILCEELGRVVDDVTSGEVERAKGSLRGGLVLSAEDTGSRMTRLGKQVAMGAPVVTLDDALEAIAEVDLDSVRQVARDVLGRPRSIAVVGPFDEGDHDRFARALT